MAWRSRHRGDRLEQSTSWKGHGVGETFTVSIRPAQVSAVRQGGKQRQGCGDPELEQAVFKSLKPPCACRSTGGHNKSGSAEAGDREI
uniref:Uncharacterized protein n=1 Tax=Kalanchoe fedtschenkoi TaxID=63787 RepID=A0A7N0UDZ1_KALFE